LRGGSRKKDPPAVKKLLVEADLPERLVEVSMMSRTTEKGKNPWVMGR